ncbi:hypothetical protein Tco_0172564 [Tanacetum coccineum]
MGSSSRWQNLTSPNAFHWLIPSREDTLDDEKTQERWDFTLLTLSKEAQAVLITDCQAGNPFKNFGYLDIRLMEGKLKMEELPRT